MAFKKTIKSAKALKKRGKKIYAALFSSFLRVPWHFLQA